MRKIMDAIDSATAKVKTYLAPKASDIARDCYELEKRHEDLCARVADLTARRRRLVDAVAERTATRVEQDVLTSELRKAELEFADLTEQFGAKQRAFETVTARERQAELDRLNAEESTDSAESQRQIADAISQIANGWEALARLGCVPWLRIGGDLSSLGCLGKFHLSVASGAHEAMPLGVPLHQALLKRIPAAQVAGETFVAAAAEKAKRAHSVPPQVGC